MPSSHNCGTGRASVALHILPRSQGRRLLPCSYCRRTNHPAKTKEFAGVSSSSPFPKDTRVWSWGSRFSCRIASVVFFPLERRPLHFCSGSSHVATAGEGTKERGLSLSFGRVDFLRCLFSTAEILPFFISRRETSVQRNEPGIFSLPLSSPRCIHSKQKASPVVRSVSDTQEWRRKKLSRHRRRSIKNTKKNIFFSPFSLLAKCQPVGF